MPSPPLSRRIQLDPLPNNNCWVLVSGLCRTPENHLGGLCRGPDKFLSFGVDVCAKSRQFWAKKTWMYVLQSGQLGGWCGGLCHCLDNCGEGVMEDHSHTRSVGTVVYSVEGLIHTLEVWFAGPEFDSWPMHYYLIFSFKFIIFSITFLGRCNCFGCVG